MARYLSEKLARLINAEVPSSRSNGWSSAPVVF